MGLFTLAFHQSLQTRRTDCFPCFVPLKQHVAVPLYCRRATFSCRYSPLFARFRLTLRSTESGTLVEIDSYHPHFAYWSGDREGVRNEDGYAKIDVRITYCTQVNPVYIADEQPNEHGGIEGIERSSKVEESSQIKDLEPIDCFYYALEIYTREKLPEYWAMLQHNLGLAYFDRIKGERWENLQKSIKCYHKSLEVFTQEEFPQKWQINQEDLSQSQEALKIEKQNLITDILDRPIKG